MTRVFLAAGVAALAITAPANAGPKQDRQAARAERQQAQPQRQQAQRQQAPRAQRQMAAPRMERASGNGRTAHGARPAGRARTAAACRARSDARRTPAGAPAACRAGPDAGRVERPARADASAAGRANRVQQQPVARSSASGASADAGSSGPAGARTRQAERQQLRADRQAQMQNMQARAPATSRWRAGSDDARRSSAAAGRSSDGPVQLRPDNVARVRPLAADRAGNPAARIATAPASFRVHAARRLWSACR